MKENRPKSRWKCRQACRKAYRRRCISLWTDGVITVFFTLLSVLFLSVLFVLLESVRCQGARAMAANIVEMGNYSVFSEFEKEMLETYELFGVDGSYGSGDFSIGRVEERWKGFLSENTSPSAEGLAALCFDPWQLSVSRGKVTEYALLTDGNGTYFYQQAVAFMRKTAITNVAGKLFEWYNKANEAKDQQEAYEKEKYAVDKEMEDLEKQEEQKKQELIEQKNELVPAAQDAPIGPPPQVKNPLPALRRLARKSLLTILFGDSKLSDGSVGRGDLVSRRRREKGNLSLAAPYGGILDDLIFTEYLLSHFSCFTEPDQKSDLQYGLEYILCGKLTDQKNLKGTAKKLLLLRESCNYLYCSGDEWMSAQAGALAGVLIGWTGMPGLVAIMKHALLLGWAYGESLLDVRVLYQGGRIPLMKTAETWVLSLDKLADINVILEKGGKDRKEGIGYKGYLRLLLDMQGPGKQKMRALDLIELHVKKTEGLSNFRADHCVIGIKDEAAFTIPPLFSRVAAVFMGTAGTGGQVSVPGGFAYE